METETKTDNELIAEFMGVQVYKTWKEMQEVPIDKLSIWSLSDKLDYHNNWSRLMEVIETMAEPVVKGDQLIRSGVDIKIFYKACELEFSPDEDFEDMDDFTTHTQGETKIEAAHKAVVEFIKWYNNQKENGNRNS